jgi:hypothetical protein
MIYRAVIQNQIQNGMTFNIKQYEVDYRCGKGKRNL